jgi:four helix bundle protein
MQNFRDLKVWQRSHLLALNIYRQTKSFPAHEQYGVTSQLRRAAVSVPTNIAEGSKRRQNRDYARFLNIAEASLAETEYLIILSRDLGYLPEDSAAALSQDVDEISRMLHSLYQKVEAKANGRGLSPPLNSQL